jgi:hypothetical protein
MKPKPLLRPVVRSTITFVVVVVVVGGVVVVDGT